MGLPVNIPVSGNWRDETLKEQDHHDLVTKLGKKCCAGPPGQHRGCRNPGMRARLLGKHNKKHSHRNNHCKNIH